MDKPALTCEMSIHAGQEEADRATRRVAIIRDYESALYNFRKAELDYYAEAAGMRTVYSWNVYQAAKREHEKAEKAYFLDLTAQLPKG